MPEWPDDEPGHRLVHGHRGHDVGPDRPAGDKCPPQKFDVSGKTATIVAGQTCMYQENDPQLGNVTYNIAYATGTFTLSGDKKMISGSGGGTLMLTAAAGNATCSFTTTISASKVGN